MVDFVNSLPTWQSICVLTIPLTVVGLGICIGFYKFISHFEEIDLKDPTSSLFRVVGILVGLMLSLAFADVILQLKTIENAVERQTVSISDMFNDQVVPLGMIQKTTGECWRKALQDI